MQLIPVIDIKDGVVVHAVAGDRSTYRPVESQLCEGSDPFVVATSLRQASRSGRLYVADLDALSGQSPQWGIIERLAELDGEIWLDVGLATADQATAFAGHSFPAARVRPIVASETLSGLDRIPEIVTALEGRSPIASLDLYAGRLRSSHIEIRQTSPSELAGHFSAAGVTTMIVLELSSVGTASGLTDHDGNRGMFSTLNPNVEMYWGGGVRCEEDLKVAMSWGYRGALVATALHQRWICGEPLPGDPRYPFPPS